MEAEAAAGLIRLLRQDQLPAPLCDLGTGYLLRLARSGRLDPLRPIKVTRNSPPLFREDEVIAFMASRMQAAREGVQ